jgi:hypothetical protein
MNTPNPLTTQGDTPQGSWREDSMLSGRGGAAKRQKVSSVKYAQIRSSAYFRDRTNSVHDPLDSINGSLPSFHRIHSFFCGVDCRSQRGTWVRGRGDR